MVTALAYNPIFNASLLMKYLANTSASSKIFCIKRIYIITVIFKNNIWPEYLPLEACDWLSAVRPTRRTNHRTGYGGCVNLVTDVTTV